MSPESAFERARAYLSVFGFRMRGATVVGHDPEAALDLAASAIDDGKASPLARSLSEKAHV